AKQYCVIDITCAVTLPVHGPHIVVLAGQCCGRNCGEQVQALTELPSHSG
ncbi:MAG: hypothetical protein JWM45_2599, partial [Pseudonocardiales bacterium]|nr:hypothetical protein [Pseudonocardiales bacterium]